MPDYRALAQALDPYAMDTGGITPDAIKMFQSGYKLPNFLGMTASQPTPQEIERMVAEQSPAFGVFPQMKPYRSQQDITASANVPVDLLRGRVAGTRGLFGDVVNQPIPMVRPLQLLSQAFTGQQKYPDTEHYLDTMPLKSNTPIGDVAGRIGSFAPINPMPAVRAGQKGLNMLGMEMADRLATGRSVLPSLLKEPQTAMFAVNPADQMAQAVTKAEVSPLGFYSAVEQQALKIPRKQGTGDSFLNDLMKGQDVKKYEIEAMGLENYLRGKPNVTRQEVQDFIANNKIDVQERVLSGTGDKSRVFSEFNPAIEKFVVYGEGSSIQGAFNTAEEANNYVKQVNAQIPYGPSTYDKYQLPGGENYREILLTLPNQWDKPRAAQIANEARIKALRQEMHGTSGTDEIRSEISRLHNENTVLQKQISDAPIYKSSHFEEPNILAHMRVNDRVDAEGKKMLLIEEVQSDWHQAGREKGYQNKSGQYGEKVSPEEYKRGVALQNQQRNQSEPLTPSEQAELNDIMGRHEASIVGGRVPDAPFKDTWHQLALKRAIKEAVDKGYDRIGLTTGAQQAERYNLSSHVQDLTLHGTGDNLRLSATAADGTHKVIDMQHVTPKTLPNYIGKEAAQKLLSQPEPDLNNPYAARNLFGADLQVGGEGMKKYYDEVYPNYLDKLGKKYGAKVGETKVNTVKERAENSMIPTMKQEPVRYLDITPEMRKAIKEGQPLASIEEELAKALA
jgi:hypothetical protein